MRVLLTGGSGTLGNAIIKSGLIENILSPSHRELDITDRKSVNEFFSRNDFGAIIHCAALARMGLCEKNPENAILANVIGTANLIIAAIGRNIRFIHISTDGVYDGKSGNFSETGPTIPYNTYGWTKLSAESCVRILKNYCIIRTQFFDKDNIRFDDAPTDAYSSMIEIRELVSALNLLLKSNFCGVVNVGGQRASNFDIFSKHKPQIKPTLFEKVQKNAGFALAKDASMNIEIWRKIQN